MSDVTWVQVDVSTFSAEAQVAYSEYKDAQRKAAQLRVAFEAVATEGLDVPAGMKVAFGYKFGKLSVALVEGTAIKAAPKAKGSLADFLAAQQANGRAV